MVCININDIYINNYFTHITTVNIIIIKILFRYFLITKTNCIYQSNIKANQTFEFIFTIIQKKKKWNDSLNYILYMLTYIIGILDIKYVH